MTEELLADPWINSAPIPSERRLDQSLRTVKREGIGSYYGFHSSAKRRDGQEKQGLCSYWVIYRGLERICLDLGSPYQHMVEPTTSKITMYNISFLDS
jgi:hypothetical protein